MPSEALFGNSTYQVDYFYHDTPSRFLTVTFTHVGVDRLDGFGFAGDFLFANNFDVVAVKSTADLWYQDFPEDAVVAIQRILGFPYVHKASYGSSMGAYAAIYFTQKLELDTALAISPQYDITVENEKRWQNSAAKINGMKIFDYRNVINDKCRYIIIFDPRLHEEMLHINPYRREIPNQNLVEMPVPFSGHPSGYFLSNIKVLKDVVLNSLMGAAPPDILPAYRQEKSSQMIYLFGLALKCLEHRKYNWATDLFERCVSLDLLHSESNIKLALLYERAGMLDEAVAHAAVAAANQINNSSIVFALARLLLKKGKRNEAEFFANHVLQLDPTSRAARELVDQMRGG